MNNDAYFSKSYLIKTTEYFEERFEKVIPKNKKDDIRRRILGLAKNPYIGKPLGNKYIRELKLNKFRIYFLVYESEIVVLVVDVSDKKHQQETIERILKNKPEYAHLVKNLNNKEVL